MQVKWFLIGVIATLFLGDWLKMKVERKQLMELSVSSTGLAESRTATVSACEDSLNEVRVMLSDVELRARVAVLVRAQSMDLFVRAHRGEQKAKDMMIDLGLDPDVQPDVFSKELQKLASRKK